MKDFLLIPVALLLMLMNLVIGGLKMVFNLFLYIATTTIIIAGGLTYIVTAPILGAITAIIKSFNKPK